MEILPFGKKRTTWNERFAHLLYIANFFFSFHLFTVVYLNSTFLSTLISRTAVGFIYMLGAALSLFGFFLIPRAVRRFGAYRVILTLLVVEGLAFLGIASIAAPPILLLLVALYLMNYPLVWFVLDMLLERTQKTERTTGSTRGIFLTMQTIASVTAPFVAGLIIVNDFYQPMYAFAAAFLVPVFLIIAIRFRRFSEPPYQNVQFRATVPCLWKDTRLRKIFASQLILRIFFSFMVIYMPIFLHQEVGFSWAEIGTLMGIILIPYFLELPFGRLADTRLGEKEILTAGFILTGGSMVIAGSMVTTSFFIWVTVLLLSRIGAAAIEIMSESYFFKLVDGDDVNTISCFRMLRPLSFLLGPAIGGIALILFPFQQIFLVLGLILLLGTFFSLRLVDTK